MSGEPRLGLRANAPQFALLVALSGVVGATVGMERSVLAPLGRDEFGVGSKTATIGAPARSASSR